ncbi:hypothetical protein PIB30_095046 [Stylosanthes scabra]|uniref:Uncharacterized protein n=1 Tax=Stylosanthes scabra TaxID=79078 RepID=A0ABU6WWK4_9FABA|nr:hypothetical protein [Stylosanthes scabra]
MSVISRVDEAGAVNLRFSSQSTFAEHLAVWVDAAKCIASDWVRNKVVACAIIMAPTRVTVPSSAAQHARRTFTLNLPRNEHGDTHRLTLHRGRFSGTITSGLGKLMQFYRLDRGEMLEVRFAGRNTFHIKVLQPVGARVV